MSVKDELIDYYSKKSKHSNYQVLPNSLKAILDGDNIQTRTRFEAERLQYILDEVDVKEKSVLDIGGNTGYFSFELIDAGAASAHCYEGNKEHTAFVELAAKALGLENIRVTNDYFAFDGSYKEHYDIVLLLNVLHHVGDDYDDKNLSIEQARGNILKQLNSMAAITDILVFQLGFNWQGNISQPLFENGTKQEMIEFIKGGANGVWDIEAIGIAQHTDAGIKYFDLNETNIERDDSLGEFLNRPIFILKSKTPYHG